MPNQEDFRPGFRLSGFDVGVLIVGILLAVIVGRGENWLGVVVAFTVAHFFLFCNVLRMSRAYELTWTALFVLMAASTILRGFPLWRHTFSAMLLCTCILTALEMRKASYHGICWRFINPNLPQWWATNIDEQ